MIYTIENQSITVAINSLGGEMMSVKTKEDDCEYLWQGNPDYWQGRAINLFPICGRLYEGKYIYRGNTYQMNAHGFLRASELSLIDHQSDSITFILTDSEATYLQYPFRFDLRVTYRLENCSIYVEFRVKNPGEEPLVFTLGGHPGFNLPLEDGLTFDDYEVGFTEGCQPEQIEFSPTCFLTGNTPAYPLSPNQGIALSHGLFNDDAVFLQKMGTKAVLRSRKGKKGVTLECKDMKYFGIWHTPKSDAPFVCLEPWLGIPSYDGRIDDFETKRDMIHLQPGEQFETGFSISLM